MVKRPEFYNMYCTICNQEFQSLSRKWATTGKKRKQALLSNWVQKHYMKKHPEEYQKWFKYLYENGYDAAYFDYGLPVDTKAIFDAESQMGDCYMCDKPAVFIAHDLPTGEKQFCSELHYCQYAGAPYHGEGYYGFTDPAKVKEPARLARARKRLKYAESFSAEEKVKAVKIVDNRFREDRTSYSYKGHRGEFNWDVHREQKGLIKYKNNFKDGHMGEGDFLPHSNKFQTPKLLKSHAKHLFRLSLDRNCHTCKEPIHKKGIGRCDWCEDDWGPSKFDDTYFYEDAWFNKLSGVQQDEYIHDLTNNNPYCRDCLYYYRGHGSNYPNKFDRESANYSLGNAVCETHWDEIVAEGGLSKDTKRHSLYEIENVSPRERMMKQRFGFGSETFEAPRNCALCGVSGHNRRTCPTKGINPFSNGDTIICKKDSGGRHKVFIVDDLAKYTESPNGEIILEHPNGLKSGFDDIDDVKYFFEVYDPTDKKYEVGFYPMLMNGRIKEYEKRFGSIQPTKQKTNKWKVGDKVKILNTADRHGYKVGDIVTITRTTMPKINQIAVVSAGRKPAVVHMSNVELVEDKYIPKDKVGDMLIDRGTRDKAIIVDYTSAKGEYHWKYLEGGAKGIFLDTPFEVLDTDIDYELYVPPKTNPRKARLKKRFGFGAENDYVKTGVASLAIITLLGLTLFKRD